VLDHVQDVCVSCAPAEDKLHDDERKPVGFVPETEETNQPNAYGGEAQLHLETAVYRPANASGNLISIDDVTKQSAHDAEPTRETNSVDGDDLDDGFFALCVTRIEEMKTDRDDRHYDLNVKVQA